MTVYLESSALLRDLLGGERAVEIRAALSGASIVVTSRITLVEVARVLTRLRVLEPQFAARIAAREAAFAAESDLWAIEPLSEEVLARCGRPFPVEPVRALDAIHLATMERASPVFRDLVMLSTDDRVRSNANALGFAVVP